MKICPACEEGKLQRKNLTDVNVNHRGVIYKVDKQTVWECDICGEQICTAEEMARLKETATKLHKEMLDAILSEKSDFYLLPFLNEIAQIENLEVIKDLLKFLIDHGKTSGIIVEPFIKFLGHEDVKLSQLVIELINIKFRKTID